MKIIFILVVMLSAGVAYMFPDQRQLHYHLLYGIFIIGIFCGLIKRRE